jgi:hypothetical protein
MTLVTLLLLLIGYPATQHDPTECWRDAGIKDLYSSFQQVEDLQRFARARSCDVMAITWQVKLLPERYSLMLWDSGTNEVVKIQVEISDVTWEVWKGVSRGDLITRDPVDLCEYVTKRTGEGRAPLSDAARGLIRVNAGAIFGPAL